MEHVTLTEREQQVLEAVIRTYVETAEPAGSRTVARRFDLGVSPATVRNAMSDLEDKGFLYHPHASAGRIPTDQAYRFYVNALMGAHRLSQADQRRLRRQLRDEKESAGALDALLRRALRVLGLLTGDLGLAVAPRLEEVILEKIEIALVSSEKLLLVLTLKNGVIRTVFADVPVAAPPETLAAVTMILNERLSGLSLSEVRATLAERLRDAALDDPQAQELVNIFLQSADEMLVSREMGQGGLVLGPASALASQPEFAEGPSLRSLIELTEQRDLLKSVLDSRPREGGGATITIGSEHAHPRLSPFTLVTSEYRVGSLSGVLGVMGPTRMPYEKVAAIVEYTSLLMGEVASARGPTSR